MMKELTELRALLMRILEGNLAGEAPPSMKQLELAVKTKLRELMRGRTALGRVTRVAQTKSIKAQLDEAAADLIAKRQGSESELEKRAKAAVAPKRAREGR